MADIVEARQWRKLVKTETLWALQAPFDGFRFTWNGEDTFVLPFDYIVDFANERVVYRPRDFWEMLATEKWERTFDTFETSPRYADLIQRHYERKQVIEVANHIVDGRLHEDLWVEREDAHGQNDGIRIHRRDWIDEKLAEGYQWEDASK